MAEVGNLAHLASGFGAGLVTIGTAYGIGRIAGFAITPPPKDWTGVYEAERK